MKCLVDNCKNKDHQGNGYYLTVTGPSYGKMGHEWICCPCWDTIVGRNLSPQNTQIYRNILEIMFNLRPNEEEHYHD